MSRRARCAAIRSAPARSNSSNSSRTKSSRWRATRITGSRGGPISTASSGHHQGYRDAEPDVHRRQVRHLLALWHDGPVAGGSQEAGAAGDLRADRDECHPQPDPQPRQAALRQSGSAPGDGAEPRPQGLHRHPDAGQGRYRRDDAAAARRIMGDAAGDAGDIAGLRSRYREEPRGSAQDHGEARLRAGQAPRGHGCPRATSRPTAIRR